MLSRLLCFSLNPSGKEGESKTGIDSKEAGGSRGGGSQKDRGLRETGGQEGAKGSRGEQGSGDMGRAFPHDFHSCLPALGPLDEKKLNAQTGA